MRPATVIVVMLVAVLWCDPLSAHGVSNRDAAFVRTVTGAAVAPFMYLGAKHMVTGYDHLLFLVGVIFYESAIEFRDGDRIVHPFTVANSGGQK